MYVFSFIENIGIKSEFASVYELIKLNGKAYRYTIVSSSYYKQLYEINEMVATRLDNPFTKYFGNTELKKLKRGVE